MGHHIQNKDRGFNHAYIPVGGGEQIILNASLCIAYKLMIIILCTQDIHSLY